MSKKRVWLYCRAAREDSEAIMLQKTLLTAFAASHGWEIVGISCDQQTGLNLERPGLFYAKEAISKQGVDVLFVFNKSRLCRDMVLLTEFINFLERHHTRLHTLTEDERLLEVIRRLR